ncbi:MAG: helicase-related protein, partial [Stellaceae bacterium]
MFLPGGAEIRAVERLLRDDPPAPGLLLAPLYGDLPQARQDEAIRPAPSGRRKLVLATAIAETSLTIEDVRVVVDGGLARSPRFEPATGMTRLVTHALSLAAAEQRRGRAGRLAPGTCYRLWSEREEPQLAAQSEPEIRQADLTPLALALAQWGNGDPAAYAWLDPPPAAAYAEAVNLLRRLDAIGADGRITRHGRAMAELGLPPRLAHMLLRGRDWGLGGLAAAVAAILGERDFLKSAPGAGDIDLRSRVEALCEGSAAPLARGITVEAAPLARVRQAARRLGQLLGVAAPEDFSFGAIAHATGRLIAQAYPERVAERRAGGLGQFRVAIGRGAFLPEADPLAAEDFLAIAALDGERRAARIFLAAPLTRADLERDFAAQIETAGEIRWDPREAAVLARRRRRLGALVLE